MEYGRQRWYARVLGLGAAAGLVVSHLGCGDGEGGTIIIFPPAAGITGPNINGNGNQIGDNNTVLTTPTPTPTATPTGTGV